MGYLTRSLEYAAHTQDNLYNARYERPGILSMLPTDLSGLHALDAGCGAGHHSAELVARGANVTALDLGPGMVEITQKRLGTQDNVFCADLSKPLDSLSDDTFDIILSSLTLHYIEDLRTPFSEFARVSSPSAKLVFSMHHPCTTVQYFPRENYFEQVRIEDAWDVQGKPFHVSYWARASLQNSERTRRVRLEPFPDPRTATSRSIRSSEDKKSLDKTSVSLCFCAKVKHSILCSNAFGACVI